MDLKEFIRDTIVDICTAVKEADALILEHHGLVNPGTHTSGEGKFINQRTTLNFDVAISVDSQKSGKAGAKAKIAVLEASIGGGTTSKNSSASRLSFSVDVVLPAPLDQKTRVGLVRKPNTQ